MIENVFMRLPALPLEYLHTFYEIKNHEELETALREATSDKEVQRALEIAHPLLLREFHNKKIKTYPAILQYLIRMSYRPTPSGLFSSIGKLIIGTQTTCFKPSHISRESHLGYTRFYLSSLEKDFPAEDCTYLTNPTLRVVDSELWLWAPVRESEIYRHKQFRYRSSEEVIALVDFCRTKRSFKDICKWSRIEGSEKATLIDYLKELIASGVIQHDFYRSNLGNHQKNESETIPKPSSKSEDLPRHTNVKADSKMILKDSEISSALLMQLHEALSGIWDISSYWKGTNYTWFENLKEVFRKNYQDKTIPLVDFLHFHLYPKTITPKKDYPDEVKLYFGELITRALSHSAQNIELSAEDISRLKEMIDYIPHKEEQIKDYSIVMSLSDESKSPYLAKIGVGAWGLGALRGKARFMHMFSEETFSVPETAGSGKIFFDIEFDSKDKFFDLSQRPYSTTHVLQLGHSKVDPSRKLIDLQDVDICLHGNFFKLFLRSEKREIVPVLTSPYLQIYHDHPVYRFFGFVAQDGQKIQLTIPFETEHLSFVPAISYKKVLITSRKWRMTKSQFEQILERPSLRPEGMPDWVSIRNFDRVFPINLTSPYIAKELLRKFQSEELLTLEDEWHLNHGKSVESNGQHFSQELLLEWTNTKLAIEKPAHYEAQNWIQPEKNPVSLEISLPASVTEIFLVRKLLPFLESLIKGRKITSYYFLRYPHPDHHLRLRLFKKATSKADLWEEIAKKCGALKGEFLLGDIRKTLFVSEKETYGGEEGERLYYKISCLLSRSYLERRKIQSEHSERLPFEICYMILLYQELLASFELPFVLPGSAPSVQTKKIVSTFRKDYRSLISGENKEMIELGSFVKKLVDQVGPLDLGRSKIDRRFFFQRIIHTEFYRVLGSEHRMIEKALPYLVARVKRHVY